MQEITKEEIIRILEEKESAVLYFYTPFCGTCQLAGRMVDVIEQVIDKLSFYKANLNFLSEIAELFAIESVPCLIILIDGEVREKIYAFHSIPHLLSVISDYQ